MGVVTSEIKVPIRLEVLQESIEVVKQVLSNLRPESASWKEVAKILSGMEKSARDVGAALNKPFNSQAQFNNAEKGIERIDDALAKAKLTLSSIKFSDIKLTTAQDQELKRLQSELTNIKNEVVKFKTEIKHNLQLSDIWQDIEQVDASAITHSFDEIVKVVSNRVSKFQTEMNKAKAAYENALEQNLKSDTTKQFFSATGAKGPLSIEGLGKEVYDQFFKVNGTFKNGQQDNFYQWMKDNLSLTTSQLESLVNKNSNELREAFKSFDVKKILDEATRTSSTAATTKTKYDLSKGQYEQAYAVLMELGKGVAEVSEKEESLSERTSNANNAIQTFINSITNAARETANAKIQQSRLTDETARLKEALKQANDQWLKQERAVASFNSIKMAIVNFMGFRQVLNLTRRAVKEAINHIKELDSVMNKISIVTDMSTSDLWDQVESYSKMAQAYGTSIKGAYEVSQIYYQQGLKTQEVLTLTNETLKLAKISGLDYAQTTDYMTTALRGFKMEAADAARVVDVYSNLAAHTAVSQEELAVAMSKTASSMESVGSTFEEASAMIGTMVAVTRESATNIGSAMKSIAARYGEMKQDPLKLVDSEGDELSFNKVDAALQSVGISMKTTNGQFRSFTDVIIELGEKWDQLESTQQRYIATQFAGNRQQSRFLALVSNIDLLRSNLKYANESEDTGTLQAIKALDSIETKIEQVKVAYQQFYTTVGAETYIKGAIDGVKEYINYLNGLPKLLGKLPVGAIAVVSNALGLIKIAAEKAIMWVADKWLTILKEAGKHSGEESADETADALRAKTDTISDIGREQGMAYAKGFVEGAANIQDVGAKTAAAVATQQVQNKLEAANAANKATHNSVPKIQSTAIPEASTLEAVKGGEAAATVAQASLLSIEEIQNKFINLHSTLTNLGLEDVLSNEISKVNIAATDIVNELSAFYDRMITAAGDKKDQVIAAFNDIGFTGIGEAVRQGIASSEPGINNTIQQLGAAILQALHDSVKMGSPSPFVIAMFKNGVGEAIEIGLTSSIDVVEEAANALGLTVTDKLKEALEKSDKINLSDYFEEGDSQTLISSIARKNQKLLSKQQDELSDKRFDLFINNGTDKEIGAIDNQIKELQKKEHKYKDLTDRILNLQYEGFTADQMIATHNFDMNRIGGMTEWGGRFPSPSIAVRAKNDKIWNDFGDTTAFMPYKYVDPNYGLSYLYRGDAYTPTIPYGTVTYDQARKSIDSQPRVDKSHMPESFRGYIRDATELYSLSQATQQLNASMALPYGAGGYRVTKTRDNDFMTQEEGYLKDLFTYYFRHGHFSEKLDTYQMNMKEPGASMTGWNAYNEAMYKFVNQMGQADFEGKILDVNEARKILSDNLYTSFRDLAKIDISTQFKDEDAQIILDDTLNYIKLLLKNPGYDWLEAKPKGDVAFKDLSGMLMPANSVVRDPYTVDRAVYAGLDPKRVFVYSEYSDASEPMSRESIGRYMMNNIPGVAFDKNGDIVSQAPVSLDIETLKSTLSSQNIDSEISSYIEGLVTNVSFENVGQILINSLKASLANIDYNSIDAPNQIEDILRFFAASFKNSSDTFEDFKVVGMRLAEQMTNAIALGLNSDLVNKVNNDQKLNKAVLDPLQKDLQPLMDAGSGFWLNSWTARGAVNEQVLNGVMNQASALISGSKVSQDFSLDLFEGLKNVDFDSNDAAEQFSNIISSFASELQDMIEADLKFSKLFTGVFGREASSMVGMGEETAKQIVAGLALGLSEDVSNAVLNANKVGQLVIDALNKGAGVASPSIYAIESGKFIMLGLAQGMDEGSQSAIEAALKASGAIITTFDSELAKTPEGILKLKEQFHTQIDSMKDLDADAKNAMRAIVDGLTPDEVAIQEKIQSILSFIRDPKLLNAYNLDNIKNNEAMPEDQKNTLLKATERIHKSEESKKRIEALRQVQAAREQYNLTETGTKERAEAIRARTEALASAKAYGFTEKQLRTNAIENTISKEQDNVILDASKFIKTKLIMEADESSASDSGKIAAKIAQEAAKENPIKIETKVNEEQAKADQDEQMDMEYESYMEQFSSMSEMPEQKNEKGILSGEIEYIAEKRKQAVQEVAAAEEQAAEKGAKAQEEFGNKVDITNRKLESQGKIGAKSSQWLSAAGMGLSTIAGFLDKTTEFGGAAAAAITMVGGALRILSKGGPMAIVTGITTVLTGLISMIENFSVEKQIERLTKKAEELDVQAKEAKANYNIIDKGLEKVEELRKKHNESAEAAEEYQTAVNELTEKFPQLIGGFDEVGNIILNTTDAENVLIEARKKNQQATYEAAETELELSKIRLERNKNNIQDIFNNMGGGAGKIFSGTTNASQNTIDAFANFANQYYYGFDKDDIDPQMIDSQIEAMVKDIAIGSQDQTRWGEYLSTVIDENGSYNYSLSSYGNFLSQQEELSPLATDILSLINTLYGNEQQTSNIAEIDEAINKFNASAGTDEIIENYNNLMKLLNQLFSTEEGKQIGAQYLTIYDQLQDLSKEIDNTVTENTLYTSFKKQVISAWQQSIHANVDAWEYLKQSSNAAGMVTDFINKTIENEYDGNYSKAKEAEETNWRRYQSAMSTFLSSLTDERLALFNTMTDDTANYSAEDIIKEFGIKDISDSQDDLYDIIINYYSSGINSIRERLINNLASITGRNLQYDTDTQSITGGQLTGFYKEYQEAILQSSTRVQEKYLNDILKQYNSLRDAGYTNRAEAFGSAALSLFKEISTAPAEIKKSLQTLINENGLTTLEGIQTIKDSIKNNSSLQGYISEDTLDLLYNNIVPNINLAIQTATSNLLDTWEDTSKELSSVMSGGVSLKDANSLITKAKSLGLDLSLKDFELAGDKLVLVGKSFNDYYNLLTSSAEKASESWEKRIKIAKGYQSILNNGMSIPDYMSEDVKASLQSIGFDYDKYIVNGKLTSTGIKALQEAIDKSVEDYNNYNLAAQIAADQLLNAHNRSQGIYQLTTNGSVLLLDQLKNIAQGLDLSGNKLGKNAVAERAIKSSINSAYDSFISDVLSKGFDNINFEDYEGLISHMENGEAKLDSIDTSSYVNFINSYAVLTGKNVDEINDLYLQAIEKDREQISEDLIKDFVFISEKFFRADRDQLGKLANAFDKPIQELLNSAAVTFDKTTQEYIVDVEKLKDEKIDLNEVDNFKLTVQESVDSIFNALASEIKNALGGSLDAKGVKTLTDDLQKMGINASLHFTKTKDGYKLAVSEVEQLYEELKKVDSLTAQIVLDELNESIEDSVTGTKVLNKEIQQLRATTESDDFKFMDKDIPSGQNNPLNYFENWGKAWKTLSDSFKSRGQNRGKIDYQDFYNIITEMGNLADRTGAIRLSGEKILRNSEDAAKLIEEGARALSVTADGSIKVDLSKLGIDFSTGANNLSKDVDAGIKDIAQSQIDMLDSMIALLETIVAMEALSDVDTNKDMVISIPEIGIASKPDEKGLQWILEYSEEYKTTKEKILDNFRQDDGSYGVLDQIKVNGQTMSAILKASVDDLKTMGIDAQTLSTLMTNLYKITKSDDFDINKPWESFMEIFAGLDWGDLQISANAGNHAIILNDEGSYSIEWSSKGAKDKIRGALDDWSKLSDKEIEDMCQKAADAAVSNKELSIKQNYLLKILNGDIKVKQEGKSKKYVVNNHQYDSYEDAVAASDLFNLKQNVKEVEVKDKKASGKITLGEFNIDVTSTGQGAKYWYNNTPYNSQNEVLKAIYEDTNEGASALDDLGQETTAFKKWKVSQGIEIMPTYTINRQTTITEKLQKQVLDLINAKDWEGVEKALNITLNPSFKQGEEADINQVNELKQLIGIESKSIDISASVSATGDTKILDAIESGTAEINVIINLLSEDTDITSIPSLNGLTAIISNYENTGDPNILVQALHAVISLYTTTEDPNILVNSLEAFISAFNTSENPDSLVSNLSAMITEYNATKDPNILVSALNAMITTYENGGDPNSVVSALKAYISEYQDKPGVKKPTLEDLTQFINDINTKGADEALAAWRAQQEKKSIVIPINPTQTPERQGAEEIINDFEQRAYQSIKKTGSFDLSSLTPEEATAIGQAYAQVGLPEYGKSIDPSAFLNRTPQAQEMLAWDLNILDSSIIPDNITGIVSLTGQVNELETSNVEGQEVTVTTTTKEVEIPETEIPESTMKIDGDTSEAKNAIEEINTQASEQVDKPVGADGSAAEATIKAINEAASKSVTKKVYVQEVNKNNGSPNSGTGGGAHEPGSAAGTVGLAKATGTLLGELGPELVVSGGRYFVAGQNGPEIMNLADDAIVFNHLQTKSLLEKGTSRGRGRAITNEQNAVSYATGNVNGGPAMASASAALAALKQLRAQWQALLNMSVKDLAGKGGGGGGGGSATDPKAFTTELEKWYNWLQKIAELEKDINRYEAERNRNASSWNKNGKLYYNSQMQSLEALKEQVDVTASLVNSQTEYFNLRRAELNSSKNPYSTLYTFDEYGQLRYKDGRLEEMSKLVGRNEYGKANMTAEQQYKELIKLVPSQYLDYDSSGNKIDKSKDDWYVTAVESFWNRVDADKEEMQGLFDSINDNTIKINNLQEEQNKLLEEMRDNQMEVEDMIMDSLVEMRQRVIDNMSKERERLQDSSEKYLSGLSDALNKEKDMYQDQQNEEETRKLQRQLAILRRSGGSGAEIRNLEEQLRNRQQDAYFEQQQKQIDAIQEASDKELERLETQITIAQETLDYQKEMGLLWQEVYEIMAGTPESIASFIESNNPERWGESNLRSETDYRDTLFKAEQWAAYRDDTRTHEEQAMPQLKSIATGDEEKRIQAEVDAKLEEQKKATTTTTTTTTNTNTNNSTAQKKTLVSTTWEASDSARCHPVYKYSDGSRKVDVSKYHDFGKTDSGGYHKCTRCGYRCKDPNYRYPEPGEKTKDRDSSEDIRKRLGSGGLITKPTEALIGETGKPEAVLNPTQTKILRENILSNSPNSLISLLKTYNDSYGQGMNTVTTNTTEGIIIQNATVEMHVDQISNDYDARRAGEQALSEIMRIARKTSAKNSVGR